MGFLIIHSDQTPNPLQPVLISADVRWVASVGAARQACSVDRGDLVIAANFSQADEIRRLDPLIDVVLAVPEQASGIDATAAMRAGVADIWAPGDFGSSAATALITRLQARQQAIRDRMRRYESEVRRDQRAGRYVQFGMLPPNPMMIGDYALRHRIVPSAELSGDFVDYFQLAQHYLVAYVADVAGHGASSAFVTVLLKNFSRRIRREYRVDMLQNPGLILAWLNRELLEQKIDKHVTMALLLIDLRTDTLLHANAGHYPQVVKVTESGDATFLDASGKPVGLFPEVTYTPVSAHLSPGSRLVLFSDGVLELLPEESLTGKEQRLLVAAKAGDRIVDVWSSLELAEGMQGPDDMSCLIVSRES
jgi:sigma-B regulation protein RsbU (phosphoserine phosphatase)